MQYSRITIETLGGRLISIVGNEGVDPGDVDYYIIYSKIPELVKAVDGRKVTPKIAKELVESGLLIKPSPQLRLRLSNVPVNSIARAGV